MLDLRATLLFWLRFLRAVRLLGVPFQLYVAGQVHQHLAHLYRSQFVEDHPLVFRNGDHHPVVSPRHLIGQMIPRDLLFNDLLAVDCAQRRFDHTHQVVRHQRYAESEQGRLGVAQRVDLAIERRLQFLERGLDGPALAVQICDCLRPGFAL
jgi:hypothetical protein